MKSARGEGLLFVGGMGRSGTSILQRSLVLHPEICGEREFQKLMNIIELRHVLHDALDKSKIDYFGDKDSFDEDIAELIERIFSRIRQREHATVFSEKTPWNVLIFEDLIQLLPGCRCIFMLRDPRAIAASLMEVGEKHQKIGFRPLPFTTSLLKAIDKTKECFESGFRAVRQYPERVLVVRYEDFVSDPEKECRRICAFLDLPWREEMLDFESKSDSLIARLPGIWNDRERLTGRIDRQSLEKWKSVLTPVQQALVTDAFQGMVELREAGYQLEPIRLGLIQRFRVSVVKAFVFHRSALIRSRARLKDTLKKSRQIRKFYYAVFK